MEVVKKFHDGLLARKKEGFKDIKEESSYLFGQLKSFGQGVPIEWDRLEKEIKCLENGISPISIQKLYFDTFLENPRIAIFRTFAKKH